MIFIWFLAFVSLCVCPQGGVGGDHVSGVRRHHQAQEKKTKVVRLCELISVLRLPPNAEACPMVRLPSSLFVHVFLLSWICIKAVLCAVFRTTCLPSVWRLRTEPWCLLLSKMNVWSGWRSCVKARFRCVNCLYPGAVTQEKLKCQNKNLDTKKIHFFLWWSIRSVCD